MGRKDDGIWGRAHLWAWSEYSQSPVGLGTVGAQLLPEHPVARCVQEALALGPAPKLRLLNLNGHLLLGDGLGHANAAGQAGGLLGKCHAWEAGGWGATARGLIEAGAMLVLR